MVLHLSGYVSADLPPRRVFLIVRRDLVWMHGKRRRRSWNPTGRLHPPVSICSHLFISVSIFCFSGGRSLICSGDKSESCLATARPGSVVLPVPRHRPNSIRLLSLPESMERTGGPQYVVHT